MSDQGLPLLHLPAFLPTSLRSFKEGVVARIWRLLSRAFLKSIDDRVPKLAAALAYYTVFSVAPLLVIAVAVAGRLYGAKAARGEVSGQLSRLVGPTAAQTIEATIRIAGRQHGGWIATTASTLVLLYGASVVFSDLQESLDIIWRVPPRLGRVIWRAPRKWLISVAVALAMGAVILLSLLFNTFLAGVDKRPSDGPWLGRSMVAWTLSFSLTSLLFAAVFKFLPDTRVPWKSAWRGAMTTAVLFTFGKFLLTLYLRLGTKTSAYGAAGSLAAMLLWFYYSAQILYFGAEVSQVDAAAEGAGAPERRRGSGSS